MSSLSLSDQYTESARIAMSRGDLASAEDAFRAAIDTSEHTPGGTQQTAAALVSLAQLKQQSGKLDEADALAARALEIRERSFGPTHLATAECLAFLGAIRSARGAMAEAEPLLTRSVAIIETELGADHPEVAVQLNQLTRVIVRQGAPARAEPLLVRLLQLTIRRAGREEHPEVATVMASLANVRQALGRHDSAEQLWRRVVEIREQTLAPGHFALATALEHLGEACAARGKLPEAISQIQRALAMREQTLGALHPSLPAVRARIADLQLQASEDFNEFGGMSVFAPQGPIRLPAPASAMSDPPAADAAAARQAAPPAPPFTYPSTAPWPAYTPPASPPSHSAGVADAFSAPAAAAPSSAASPTPPDAAKQTAAPKPPIDEWESFSATAKAPADERASFATTAKPPIDEPPSFSTSAADPGAAAEAPAADAMNPFAGIVWDAFSGAAGIDAELEGDDEDLYAPIQSRLRRTMEAVAATVRQRRALIAATLLIAIVMFVGVMELRGSNGSALVAELPDANGFVTSASASGALLSPVTPAGPALARPASVAAPVERRETAAPAARGSSDEPVSLRAASRSGDEEQVARLPVVRAPEMNDVSRAIETRTSGLFDSDANAIDPRITFRDRAGANLASLDAPAYTPGDSPSPVLIDGTLELAVPMRLRQSRIEQGDVLARFVVDETGRIDLNSLVIVESNHRLFIEAVREVLPGMRFRPARVGGINVRRPVEMRFTFPLEKRR